MAFRRVTKEQMIELLRELKERGWIASLRPLNSGGIGNTIDALLGFPENNLPIADTAQWELKSHRVGSSSLLTLFHMDPEPTDQSVVPRILLPGYGWPAGPRHPGELSFRQTLRATAPTDRGFGLVVDRIQEKVLVYFDATKVQDRHGEWLESVQKRTGLGALRPEIYWTFRDLFRKASTKMLNSFYVDAEARKEKQEEFFRIVRVLVLEGFDIDRFAGAIEAGSALVDFDARTGHNHGTKFRLRQSVVPLLYRYSDEVLHGD